MRSLPKLTLDTSPLRDLCRPFIGGERSAARAPPASRSRRGGQQQPGTPSSLCRPEGRSGRWREPTPRHTDLGTATQPSAMKPDAPMTATRPLGTLGALALPPRAPWGSGVCGMCPRRIALARDRSVSGAFGYDPADATEAGMDRASQANMGGLRQLPGRVVREARHHGDVVPARRQCPAEDPRQRRRPGLGRVPLTE